MARRAPFQEFQRLPFGAHGRGLGGRAHRGGCGSAPACRLAPFYHPLRLAEEVALLDVLSGGRVNWGAGRGFARVEFENFGVPPEESTSRFREAVEIVLRAWTEERLSFTGEHFRFDGGRGIAEASAAAAPAGMDGGDLGVRDRLGGRARFLDPDGPAFSHRDIGRKRRYYPEAGRPPGFDRGPRHCRSRGWWRWATPPAEARGVARRGAQWIVNSYFGAQHGPVGVTDPRRRGVDRCSAISTR